MVKMLGTLISNSPKAGRNCTTYHAVQACQVARAIAAELQGKAAQKAGPPRRSASPSPDPLYIRAVMAVLQCCFQGGAGSTAGRLHMHVCWVLLALRGMLQMNGLEHAPQILQACTLAACDWHATKARDLPPEPVLCL